MRSVPLLLLAIAAPAWAVPLQITSQGRVVQPAGPVTGAHSVVFRLYAQSTGGASVWDQTKSLTFDDGYYTSVLGDDDSLDTDLFASGPLYLELAIDGAAIGGFRPAVTAVPWAFRAALAEGVAPGLELDVASIRVDGQLVIDGDGSFTGTIDGPTLGDLSCAAAGDLATWNGTAWTCASPDALSASDVVAIVEGQALTLHAGTTLGGAALATTADLPTEATVEAWIEGDAIALAAGSTVGGVAIASLTDVPDASTVAGWLAGDTVDLAAGSTLDGATIATIADLPGPGSFAGADQACVPGRVVTGIAADGTLECGSLASAADAIRFTTCGAYGRNGPTTAMCAAEYGAEWAWDEARFTVNAGIQRWTVPVSGNYRITAVGARGGTVVIDSDNTTGRSHAGRGALMSGVFALTAGQQLSILVGQHGEDAYYVGGGGGATYVVDAGQNTPLAVAGGGAGAYRNIDARTVCADAGTSNTGRTGTYPGGSAGAGGGGGSNSGASSGGGGFSGNGGNGIGAATGGLGFTSGGAGGACDYECGWQSGEGGFGGGGGAYGNDASPGGGGYGGGGGSYATGNRTGGGGGSFLAGSATAQTAAQGVGTDDGYVTIHLIP